MFHSIACNCIDCNPSPTRMIGGNMNTNTTTPVAQYQFSNAELQIIKILISHVYNSDADFSQSEDKQFISLEQTINTILAARNSRG